MDYVGIMLLVYVTASATLAIVISTVGIKH